MLVLRLALRNLWLHKAKTLIVGSILWLGTVLVIVGSGLLDAVDHGMETSLVHSVAGHIQLYSAAAKEPFQLFGNFDGSMPDSGRFQNFGRVYRVITALDNVQTVVPMGIDIAITTTHNILERRLADLRQAVRSSNSKRISLIKRQVRRIIALLSNQLQHAEELVDIDRYRRLHGDYRPLLARARSDAFWRDFERAPLDGLEFLENEIGPMALSEDMIWVRYLGTDTALFQKTFNRFEIVQGTMIPPGKRGFLFNEQVYDEMVKNKTARRLDKIKNKLADGIPIAHCEDCRAWIQRNVSQAASLAYQLDDDAAADIGRRLRAHLGSSEQDIISLLRAFMQMDDGNFARRYKFFYDVIAPRIVLYTVAIGDEFVLTASARGGYIRRVPIKVYGTFRFRSLDRSPLAGGFNLLDLVSFRDLYGYLTTEAKQEQAAIRSSAHVKDVTRGEADHLFDRTDNLVVEERSQSFDPTHEVDLKAGGQRYNAATERHVYSRKEMWDGVVLNAAVMLKDGSRLKESLAAIRKAIKREGLGLQAVTWREASGIVGQMVMVIRAVLYAAVAVIFIVALIIINNSLLMSTMERTREIGTFRAIGAQRRFIMSMFLAETGVLSLLFGGLGAVCGSLLMLLLSRVGIAARGNFLHFLFAGPRLYPTVQATHIVTAFAVIAVVAIISTLYPARVATRITPREAMATEE